MVEHLHGRSQSGVEVQGVPEKRMEHEKACQGNSKNHRAAIWVT